MQKGSSGIYSSSHVDPPSSSTSSSGVSSINTLTGAITLAAGTNITLTTVGTIITIDASGGGSITGPATEVLYFDPTGGGSAPAISDSGFNRTGLDGQTELRHDDGAGSTARVALTTTTLSEDFYDAAGNSHNINKYSEQWREDFTDTAGNSSSYRVSAALERITFSNATNSTTRSQAADVFDVTSNGPSSDGNLYASDIEAAMTISNGGERSGIEVDTVNLSIIHHNGSTETRVIMPTDPPSIGDVLKITANPVAGVYESQWDTTAGSGTVTSVGLSMPSAFSVSGSPITGAGTFSVTATGTTAQYIRGDGSLATLPTGGLALETDGTPNGDQTLLNLAAGTNITLTDNGTGTVTIDASGGGGGITALTGDVTASGSGSVAATLATTYKRDKIGVVLDGAGGVIAAPSYSNATRIPFTGTITGWEIISTNTSGVALSGSIVVDIWIGPNGSVPTVANTIFSGNKPTLSSASYNTNTSMSVAVTAGQIAIAKVESATTCVLVDVSLQVTRS